MAQFRMAEAKPMVRSGGVADAQGARLGRLARAFAVIAGLLSMLGACMPAHQRALTPPTDFAGPRFVADRFISFDGAALGLLHWAPADDAEPSVVVIGLHGMNDYAATFDMAGPWWAQRGVATYAIDQRGFGRSPQRGVWGGHDLMANDLRAALSAARRAHPDATLVVVGESMGAAVALHALGEGPLDADRIVLAAPAVWGWSNLPLAYRATLWLGAHTAPSRVVTPPRGVVRKITASDNIEMLRRIGRDPNMLFETRIDAVYGLVRLMERAYRNAGRATPQTLVLYGSRDQIIPKRAMIRTSRRLPPAVRTAQYPEGYHMLLRDLQAERVWADILAFASDPAAPLPSGSPGLFAGESAKP